MPSDRVVGDADGNVEHGLQTLQPPQADELRRRRVDADRVQRDDLRCARVSQQVDGPLCLVVGLEPERDQHRLTGAADALQERPVARLPGTDFQPGHIQLAREEVQRLLVVRRREEHEPALVRVRLQPLQLVVRELA